MSVLWRSGPNAIIPTLATLLLSPSLYLWHHREVTYHQLTEEEKTRAWFTEDSVYAGATPKWRAAALQSITGTTLQESCVEKSSQWTELQAVHLVVHFTWKEKWPDVYILIHVSSGLAGGSGTWKEQDWKIGCKKMWGRGMRIDLCMGKKCEDICAP